jgi:hypothetical protein
MILASRRGYSFTVCVRDDDRRTYEFHLTDDSTPIVDRVAAAVSGGRSVGYCILAADANARAREVRYLSDRDTRLRR